MTGYKDQLLAAQEDSTVISKGFTGKTIVPSFGPRVGIAFAPLKSLVLRGNYGRSFRPPTPQELAEAAINSDFNQGRFVGNPQLTGQYVDAVELGFEWVQSLGDARLRLKGLGFFNRFTNPIAQVDFTGNLAPFVNRPEGVQSFGLEGEGRLELLSRSSVWINSSWFRAEDLGAAQNGRLLTDQPQVRVNAGLSWPLGPFLNLDVILRHASERRSDARTAATEILQRVGLGERLRHYPRVLSGGEQQRVALARAFVVRPAVLLADEPTGSLDFATGERVMELMFEMNREAGTTLVLVTHDRAIAGRCDRQLRIEAGRLVDAPALQAASVGSA